MDAGVQVFDPVRQWPYLSLTIQVFFKSLFWPTTSVTIPWTRFVRLWYGHWHPSLKYLRKKNRSDRPRYGHWHLGRKRHQKKMKKPGLWDRGVATGGPGQKPDRKKMIRSVRQRYGLWRVKIIVKYESQFLSLEWASDASWSGGAMEQPEFAPILLKQEQSKFFFTTGAGVGACSILVEAGPKKSCS